MVRPDDMKLPADTVWLSEPGTQALANAFGGAVYFVGGCVRDALLQRGGGDVDLSTPLRPETVTQMAEKAGFKAVPTGIEHGTITVVVQGRGYEVTTFRRDVETDGRRAVVSFSEDMRDDALRRDFTLNALYATPDGDVIDPLGCGLSDCLARRIRFIEDADTRIREDYLRILRYFRFWATYASPEDGFDTDALDAISRNSRGLETLSAERIGSEMKKLLAAPDPSAAVAAMRATGCLPRVLPGSDDRLLAPTVHLAQTIGLAADPILRLAALGGEDPADRLRLSRDDARRLQTVSQAGFGADPLPEVAYRNDADIARGAAVLRAALSEEPIDPKLLHDIDRAAQAVFPVRAKDLMPQLSGPALGVALKKMERRWILSGFSLSRDDLLAQK